MSIDLNALSGRIKAEEQACDNIRGRLAHTDLSEISARVLRGMLERKEKWLRESRTLYAQKCQRRDVR